MLTALESIAAEINDIVMVLGVLIATISLIFAAINTRLTFKATQASFWLSFRDLLSRHNNVHLRLRPGGAWTKEKDSDPDTGPKTPEEWAEVEAYMGVFEHGEIMLKARLIDETTFRKVYSYRLENIVANQTIRKKLVNQRAGWFDFLALLSRMDIAIADDKSISTDSE